MKPKEFWRVEIDRTRGFNIASRSDFELMERVIDADYDLSECIPYCIDYSNNAIAYSCGLNQRTAATAPFHYRYLRDYTRLMAIVPLESRLKSPYKIPMDPAFIFSMGRCGSTLVAQFLRKLGRICIAESDIFSQAL